jgi:hypothetical protein
MDLTILNWTQLFSFWYFLLWCCCVQYPENMNTFYLLFKDRFVLFLHEYFALFLWGFIIVFAPQKKVTKMSCTSEDKQEALLHEVIYHF